MPKKAAGRKTQPASRIKRKGVVLAFCLVVSIISTGAALALWGPARTVPATPSPVATTAAAPAAVALQSQNSFAASSPSKEYIYAGGRLVATEEPARLDQAITFTQPADKTYGDQPFTLSATSSSGLAVSFTITSGPATVSGSTVTITGAGTVTVEADQAGSSNYNPAQAVSRSFTVAKANAAVTLSNLSQTYNGSARTASASTTPQGLSVTITYGGSTTAPTGAGNYAVVATVNDANFQGSASGTLAVAKATATVSLSNLTQTYDGSAKSASATTTPAGLGVSLTYNGSSSAPANAGSYTVAATVNDANYQGTASGTLNIGKASATVTLSNLSQTYNGTARAASASTTPSGLGVTLTYGGSTTAPTNAGSYAVVATVADTNYQGSVSGTLTIAKASATVSLSNLTQTYDGSAKSASATTTPAGLSVSFTYDGSSSAPVNAGSYAVAATVSDTNYQGTTSGTLTVNKASVTIALSNLTQTYNGSARSATATTSPAGLGTVSITYNSSTTAPSNAGSYSVSATLSNANYSASAATGTLVINKATATVTLGGLTGQVYDGTAKSATATTSPAGLTVNIAYAQNGSGVASPTGAGSYDVTATVNDSNYQGSATGTLIISKASATLTLGGITGHTYNGSAQTATASTTPTGLSGVTITYGGSTTAPTAAGSYAVVASLSNANYSATSVSGTMAVAKATPTITWNNPADIGQGTALGSTQLNATASAAGTFAYTPASGTVLGVGNNQALSVSFTPTDTTDYNAASATAHINVIGCPIAGSSTFTGTSPILTGSSSTLSWNVPYANSVSISSVSGTLGTFGSTGSASVTPTATTTYTLTATGASVCTNMTKQTTVVVNTQSCPHANPHFPVFTASPDTVTVGGSSTLSWSAPGATHVRVYIDGTCQPSDSSCELYSGSPSSGSITVSPSETTIYDFEATGTQGCTPLTGQAQVAVMGDPATCSPNATFTTTPASGNCNGNITINWSVPNAMNVSIELDGLNGVELGYYEGSAAQSGQITIAEGGQTASYTLTAQLLTIENEDGSPDSCGTIQLHTTHTCP